MKGERVTNVEEDCWWYAFSVLFVEKKENLPYGIRGGLSLWRAAFHFFGMMGCHVFSQTDPPAHEPILFFPTRKPHAERHASDPGFVHDVED
ncbi:hypothetical protein PAECIP111802_05970 [Paenibacillus allorhizosphaerae]|uniref:Uncharacterized protein n=1 Tax=Paenibacillus allorhizosphaerae TaxID=2849866 RepID=A0ABM8VR63_9BACL|nr:hypothetical protein PAECIP111802_05970 [Paenibacillus allorhizosphaerae]